MTIVTDHPFITSLNQFMDTFGVKRDPALWKTLFEEECAELKEAVEHLAKEIADVHYTLTGYCLALEAEGVENAYDIAQELAGTVDDHMAFLNKIASDANSEETLDAFKEVHRSNMSKVGDDGKPIFREDGKVLKGPNFSPADMASVIVGRV